MDAPIMCQAVCDVCFNEYSTTQFRVLHCGHCFCVDCMEELKKDNRPSCPHCRREIVTEPTDGRLADGQPLYISLVNVSETSPPSDVEPAGALIPYTGGYTSMADARNVLEKSFSERFGQPLLESTEIQDLLRQIEVEERSQESSSGMASAFKDCLLFLFSRIEDVENQLSTEQAEATSRDQQTTNLTTTIDSLEARMGTMEVEIAESREKLDTAVEQSQMLSQALDALQTELEKLENAQASTSVQRDTAIVDFVQGELSLASERAKLSEDRAQELTSAMEATEASLASERERTESLTTTIEVYKAQIECLEADFQQAEQDNEVLRARVEEEHTAHTEVETHHVQIERLENELNEAKEENARWKMRLEFLDALSPTNPAEPGSSSTTDTTHIHSPSEGMNNRPLSSYL